jgi:GDP-4-dehydro-6-deoxy-D-mannose reductase
MKRVLITGYGGFVGPYVADALVEAGHRVWGVDEKPSIPDTRVEGYVSRDLSDRQSVEALFDAVSPDAVVHLAAQSSAGRSFAEPFDTLTRNIWPVLNILETVRKRGIQTRILAVGSGEIYGPAAEADLPLPETRAPNPVNPYALSKAIQEQCCLHYASLYGTDVVATRSFNHTGAGQRDTFVLPSFARQVREIRDGIREPVVNVGDIDLRRDFTDVRDIARGYVALLEKGKGGEVYNVGSGTSYSLRELLHRLFEIARVEPEIRVDSERMRPADMRDLRGDPSKIARDTGWTPRIAIADTLEWLFDACGGDSESTGRPQG